MPYPVFDLKSPVKLVTWSSVVYMCKYAYVCTCKYSASSVYMALDIKCVGGSRDVCWLLFTG